MYNCSATNSSIIQMDIKDEPSLEDNPFELSESDEEEEDVKVNQSVKIEDGELGDVGSPNRL